MVKSVFTLIGEYLLTKPQNRGSSADKPLTKSICFIRMYKKCNDIFQIIPDNCSQKLERETKDQKIMMDRRWKEEKGGEEKAK